MKGTCSSSTDIQRVKKEKKRDGKKLYKPKLVLTALWDAQSDFTRKTPTVAQRN